MPRNPAGLFSLLVCAICLLCSACTPLRSRLKPPYLINDAVYDEAAVQTYAAAQCAGHEGDGVIPPHPFTTDGCSMWPDGTWRECCVVHDVSYWCGGPEKRSIADRNLQACVRRKSTRANAFFMYLGVRLGGYRWWPFPWRWGYGYPWPYRQAQPQ